MSTIAVIAIIVGALIVLALLVSLSGKAKRRRELGRTQERAQRDDAEHHRSEAEDRRREAAIAEERARRVAAEAEAHEERAARREAELGS
jgi:FtsZ-interacting cell division protein ZipA